MEKTILIDGRPVAFKATGGIGYRYKSQFGREFIADVSVLEEFATSAKVKKVPKKDNKGKNVFVGGKIQFEEKAEYDFTKFSLESMYNILWTLAKTADDSIPAPQAWLDSFNVFPVMDIFEQVKDILEQNFKVTPKNA